MQSLPNPTIAIKLDLAEFSARYGHSARRQMLICILEREMTRIATLEGSARCLVFGSMVTSDKSDPGDIDVIVSLSSHRMPVAWLNETELWHAFALRMTPPSPPAIAEMMVERFNRDLAEGFSLHAHQCVELLFEPPHL